MPDGTTIQPSASMNFLGCNLYSDGKLRDELNQKLAVAWSDFQKLARVWRDDQTSKQRKLQAFQSMVIGRLLYGVSIARLNTGGFASIERLSSEMLAVYLQNTRSFRVASVEPTRVASGGLSGAGHATPEASADALWSDCTVTAFGHYARSNIQPWLGSPGH